MTSTKQAIASIWRSHRAGKKHPDARGKSCGSWPQLEKLKNSKLSLIVKVNESAIIRDADTGEVVAVVLRKFVRNDEVLEWISSVPDENVGLRRGIRVSEPTSSVL